MSQEEIREFIKANIGRHGEFALGTVDENGNPWVVCLNLSYDENFNIIWKSVNFTQHSKYIQTNPNVGICVFSRTTEVGDFGLYAKAVAHEVADEAELRHVIDVRFTQKGEPTPDVSKFTGDSPVRLYVAEIKEAWVNDDSHKKYQIDLNILRS